MTTHKSSEDLDAALGQLSVEPAPPGLNRRILTELPEDGWQRLSRWFSASIWRPALFATLCLAFGFAIGLIQPEPLDQQLADDLSMLAFTTDFAELPYDD